MDLVRGLGETWHLDQYLLATGFEPPFVFVNLHALVLFSRT